MQTKIDQQIQHLQSLNNILMQQVAAAATRNNNNSVNDIRNALTQIEKNNNYIDALNLIKKL